MPTKHAADATFLLNHLTERQGRVDAQQLGLWAACGQIHALLEIAAQIERLADSRQRRHGHKIGGDDEFAKYERHFAGES